MLEFVFCRLLILLTLSLYSSISLGTASFEELPEELFVHTFKYCDLQSIGRSAQVEQYCNRLFENKRDIWEAHLGSFFDRSDLNTAYQVRQLVKEQELMRKALFGRKKFKAKKMLNYGIKGKFRKIPQSVEYYYNYNSALKIGLQMSKEKKFEKALVAFQHISEDTAHTPEALGAIADSLFGTGRIEEARGFYTEYYKILADFNIQDTRLVRSVRNKNIELSTLLVSCGADVDQRDLGWGSTTLMFAAQSGDYQHVRLLLEYGADWTLTSLTVHKDSFGFAMERIDLEVLRAFLDSGLDVDHRDLVYGSTALMFAAQQGNEDLVLFLLSRGADKNLLSLAAGKTAYQFANQENIRKLLR